MLKFNADAIPFPILATLFLGNMLWVVAYVLAIRRGFLDKIYGIPMVAIATNFSWEFIFSFIYPHPHPIIYNTVFYVLLDGVIVYQYLKFAEKDFIPNLSRRWIVPLFIANLAISSALIITITNRFEDEGWHSAYADNMMMSILFNIMLLRRNSVAGQSLYIALLKGISSAAAAVCFLLIFGIQPIFVVMATVMLLADATYVYLVYTKSLEQGFNPWLRA